MIGDFLKLESKACNLLALEDRTLTTLGVNVNFYRFGLSLLAVLLCSISVSVVGVIGFIALLVPHVSRLLVGLEHKYLLPVSFLIGMIVYKHNELRQSFLLSLQEYSRHLDKEA